MSRGENRSGAESRITNDESRFVRFLYSTKFGRGIMTMALRCGFGRIAAVFLRSPLSRPMIRGYIKRNNIPMQDFEGQRYRSFAEFFIRRREDIPVDSEPSHLISPCDGWLSVFRIDEDSRFEIKGSSYRLEDILSGADGEDAGLAKKFHGGDCLILRLCASDYHRFCYIDDGYIGARNFVPGTLHSVQPAACAAYPVYKLNRRVWSRIDTANFGTVVQSEVGAFLVGGIRHEHENAECRRGAEMGRFELAGSTIVLLFEKGRISILPHISEHLREHEEYRVTQGMWIASAPQHLL